MQVKCEFKTYIPLSSTFVIQFSIILTKNENIDLEPLEILLQEQTEEEKKFENLSFDN